jgi:phthiocerol/phenolphthiocerol synthesis type-I polyketide synthase E
MLSNQTFDQIPTWDGAGPEPIAIVGMAGRFPMAKNVREFWSRLYNAEDCISRLTPEQLEAEGIDPAIFEDPDYVAAAPVLENIEQFDAEFFGITPREAELMDPQHRIFLECCWEALEDAGYDPKHCGQAMGVFAGARADTYLLNIFSHPGLVQAVGPVHLGLGNDLAFLSSRVSHFLNLTGPAVSVHTACSTALVAVHIACEHLRQLRCDAALAGGIAINVPQHVGYRYEEASLQSPDGRCRAFDASARGMVFGSGAGVVVLKRLRDALANRDSICALILGSAINNDGANKASFTTPSAQGQVNVIREALRNADVSPDTIGYIECHGTGTPLGDAIEVRALIKAFGEGAPGSCAIGSVKTNVGHLDAAAGISGLIKTALSLRHQTIPASLHYERPNPQISFAGTRFYVNTITSPWEQAAGPRRAGISAFGVGGTNAHIVLEEAPSLPQSASEEALQVLPLSARSGKALNRACRDLAEHLREHPHLNLSDIAFTLQEGRHPFGFRRALVCKGTEDAIAALDRSTDWDEVSQNCWSTIPPTVSFLFPGQGAQYPGMGKELYAKEPVFRKHIRQCSDILAPYLDHDLVALLYEVPSSAEPTSDIDLSETSIAHPALLAVEFALASLWMSWGVEPESIFGHSVGEYTAAVLAGVMSIEEALRLVAVRGQLVREIAPGAMLAVALSEADIAPLLNDELAVAALNAFDMCTVAGTPDAIQTLAKELKAEGITYQPLRASHAFHTPLIEPVINPFLAELGRIRLNPPRIPFISCITGTWIQPEEAQSPEYWARQMRLPVQFDAGLTELLSRENRMLLDVGPGQTLYGMALRKSRSYEGCQVLAAMQPSVGSSEQRSVLTALTELWRLGAPLEWPRIRRGQARRISLPTYPFERKRYWIDRVKGSTRTGLSNFAQPRNSDGDLSPLKTPRPNLRNIYVAPQNDLELMLAGLWEEFLGLDQVGIHDDFFELGGHSLLATRLVTEVRSKTGAELPLAKLFEEPTIRQMAETILSANTSPISI